MYAHKIYIILSVWKYLPNWKEAIEYVSFQYEITRFIQKQLPSSNVFPAALSALIEERKQL